GQLPIVAPLLSKSITPVGLEPVTVAVNVTGAPTNEGDPLVATATAETACGTNGLEGALGGLEPVALRAVTVHVSATPFASPVTPIGEPVPVAFCVPQV